MLILEKLKEIVSKKDFKKKKFGIALKEADETKYWMEILKDTGRNVPDSLFKKCEELIKILVAITKNS